MQRRRSRRAYPHPVEAITKASPSRIHRFCGDNYLGLNFAVKRWLHHSNCMYIDSLPAGCGRGSTPGEQEAPMTISHGWTQRDFDADVDEAAADADAGPPAKSSGTALEK